MADVSIEMIKDLRARTSAGVSLCKEALAASDGDIEEAILYIRKKDSAQADKKAERATGDGVVGVLVADDGSAGALVEVACETDFVAKNEMFQTMVSDMLAAVIGADALDDVESLVTADGTPISERLKACIATIGENMKLRRVTVLRAPEGGLVSGYSHFTGKLGCLAAVSLDGADADKMQEAVRDVCMHIASTPDRPIALTPDDIPEEMLAREKEVFQEDIKGKPENIQEKILEGKLGKFYSGVCLGRQKFVKDESLTVDDHLSAAAKDAGGSAALAGFARLELGVGCTCVGGDSIQLAE